MADDRELKERILDCALEQGEASGWDNIRLHDIADSLGIGLSDIELYYRQKDDLVEAWFDRADQAMLSLPEDELAALDVDKRLHRIIFAWFDKLCEHKTLTGQMLRYKFEPLHFHLQFQGITRISRTVQWFMEKAQLDCSGIRRVATEMGLTTIYLATFTVWQFDRSENQDRTRDLLSRKLAFFFFCSNGK